MNQYFHHEALENAWSVVRRFAKEEQTARASLAGASEDHSEAPYYAGLETLQTDSLKALLQAGTEQFMSEIADRHRVEAAIWSLLCSHRHLFKNFAPHIQTMAAVSVRNFVIAEYEQIMETKLAPGVGIWNWWRPYSDCSVHMKHFWLQLATRDISNSEVVSQANEAFTKEEEEYRRSSEF